MSNQEINRLKRLLRLGNRTWKENSAPIEDGQVLKTAIHGILRATCAQGEAFVTLHRYGQKVTAESHIRAMVELYIDSRWALEPGDEARAAKILLARDDKMQKARQRAIHNAMKKGTVADKEKGKSFISTYKDVSSQIQEIQEMHGTEDGWIETATKCKDIDGRKENRGAEISTKEFWDLNSAWYNESVHGLLYRLYLNNWPDEEGKKAMEFMLEFENAKLASNILHDIICTFRKEFGITKAESY